MTTPTSNPVPSDNPNDLLFNAEQFDVALNSTAASYTDRLGMVRRTVKGQFDAVDAELAAKLGDAQSQINIKVNEASGYADDAADSALEALGYLQTYRATSYGALASDPATDPLGNPPTVGDEYFNTTSNLLKRFNGTTWQASDINTANLAAPSGSSFVGYDGQTVQDVLDGAKSLQDYAALRAYTGRAKRIYITGQLVTAKPAGIAGVFQYDPTDTTSADNGGTVIIGSDGRRWKRDYSGAVNIKWFGATGLASGDDTDALSRALLSIKQTGGTIRATEGTYMIDPFDLREYNNITIEGDNASTDWPYLPTTVFKFRTAGDVGFKLSDVTTTSIPAQSARGVVLKNLFIHGNSLVNTCVNMNRPTALEHVVVRYAAQDGIVFEAMTYPVTLRNVNSGFNGRYGIHCKSPYTTTYTMYDCEFGSNGSHGLFIEGGSACVFISVRAQANGGDGFFVSRPDPAGFTHSVYLDRLTFIGCYTEGNAGWGFRSTSYNNNPAQFAGKIEDMTFINCAFNSGNGQAVQIRGTRNVYHRGCGAAFEVAGAVDPLYNTVSLNYYRIEGNLLVAASIDLAGGRAKFPATQNPSTDPNTLDDYKEGSFAPTIIGSTTAGSATYSLQVGRYTKIGNIVNFDITIQWSGHTGSGDILIDGIPYAHGGVGSSVFPVVSGNLAVPTGSSPIARLSSTSSRISVLYITESGVADGLPLPVDTAATITVSGTYRVN